MNWQQFLYWEKASRDTIDFKTIYVDITNDLIAGLLLSQIIFWHLPDKSGRTKLRVSRLGRAWLAKAHGEWHQEIRISSDQARRALAILKKLDLVEVANFKFDGSPKTHIHLKGQKLLELLANHENEASNPESTPTWDNPKSTWATAQMDLGSSPDGLGPQPRTITENTTENTTETTTENTTPPNPLKGECAAVEKDFAFEKAWLKQNTADLPEPPTPPKPEESPPEKESLVQLLNEQGISVPTAKRLVNQFSAQAIMRQLRWLPFRDAKIPAAMLRKAIENNYAEPKGYQEAQAQEKEAEDKKAQAALFAPVIEKFRKVRAAITAKGEKVRIQSITENRVMYVLEGQFNAQTAPIDVLLEWEEA